MDKKVLVIGSGGREHALAWKLAQSPQVAKVYCAPGNGGISEVAECVDINFTDVSGLLDFALKNKFDLTAVGQEAASEAGVVDAFHEAGLNIFGPTKAACLIESSKVFSKDLMAEQNIPTATYETFNDLNTATNYLAKCDTPIVIKADGLAAGKGVIICETKAEALKALEDIMVKKIFGDAGNRIIIESFLKGQEVSVHALCDGNNSAIFPASQDHKQVFDGDNGPNTGGMGVIAPVPWVSSSHLDFVQNSVILPALSGLKNKKSTFNGCLYPGLMIDGEDIKLLEFNARFGDPEAEVYMRLLQGDFYQILLDCAKGKLDPSTVKWQDEYAVTVVLASGGYPGNYKTGLPISGLDKASKLEDIVIFHSGTKKTSDGYSTAGGRVLNVTATGSTLDIALAKAYEAIKLINFDGMHYRTDIGKRTIPA